MDHESHKSARIRRNQGALNGLFPSPCRVLVRQEFWKDLGANVQHEFPATVDILRDSHEQSIRHGTPDSIEFTHVRRGSPDPAETSDRRSPLPVVFDWFNPASPAEISQVLDIIRATSHADIDAPLLMAAIQLGRLVRCAWIGSQIVGVLMYGVTPDRLGREIVILAIRPEWQRRGIGRGLVDVLFKSMANAPHDQQIRVEVPERLIAAQRFFRDCEFRWIETVSHDAIAFYAMVKRLRDEG